MIWSGNLPRGIVALSCFIVVGLLAPGLPAQDAPATRPVTRTTTRPDFTPAGLERRLAELRPAIETEIGRPFGEPLVVVARTGGELAEILVEEHVAGIPELPGDDEPRHELIDEIRASAQKVVPGLLAKVDLLTGSINVVPEHFRSSIYEHGQRDLYSQDVLDVVLIHESIHVHQVRHLGLRRMLGRPATADEDRARMAVIEGHAEAMTRRVAVRLGLLPAFERLQQSVTDVPLLVQDDPGESMAKSEIESIVFAYIEGEKFFEEIAAKLGTDVARDHVFAHPPTTPREITHPPEYLEPPARRLDVDALGRSLQRLSPLGYADGMGELTATQLRTSMRYLPPARLDEILRGFAAGASLIGRPRIPNQSSRIFRVEALNCTDDAAARARYAGLLEVLEKGDEVLSNPDLAVEVLSSTYGDATIEGAAARFGKKRMRLKGEPKPVGYQAVVAQRGRWVVTLSGFGDSLGVDGLVKKAQRAFDLAEAESLVAAPPASEPAAAAESRAGSPAETKVRVRYRDGDDGPERFRVDVWFGGPAFGALQLEGRSGRFVIPRHDAATARIGAIYLDGEAVDDAMGVDVPCGAADEATLAIERVRRISLVAVDEPGGTPIATATARRYLGDIHGKQEVAVVAPPDEQLAGPVVKAAGGPLRIRQHAHAVVVGAPGHAFVLVHPGDGDAVQEIVLPRSGMARVHIASRGDFDGVMVFAQRLEIDGGVFQFTEPWRCGEPSETGDLVVDHLAPGYYGFTVRHGEAAGGGAVIGTAHAVIAAGQTVEVTVTADPLRARHSVKGQVTVPLEWGRRRELSLRLVGLDPRNHGTMHTFDTEVTANQREVEFEFDDVAEGRWGFFVDELQWLIPLDVRGETKLQLVVPAPVEVKLHVADRISNKRVAEVTGRFTGLFEIDGEWVAATDLNRDLDPRELPPSEGRGDFRVLCPPGWVRFEAEGPTHLTAEIEVDLESGKPATETLLLTRAGGVEVTLHVGGAAFAGAATVILRRDDDVGSDLAAEVDESSIHRFTNVPIGVWKVIVQPVEGFARVRPRTIEVTHGGIAEVSIDLTRRPESRR